MLHWQESALGVNARERTPADRRKGRPSLDGVLAAFIFTSAASIRVVEGDFQQKEE
jgi:hypothetical protein